MSIKISDEEKKVLAELVFGYCGKLLNADKSNRNIIYNANIIFDNQKIWR